jgi:hypothetical protein
MKVLVRAETETLHLGGAGGVGTVSGYPKMLVSLCDFTIAHFFAGVNATAVSV